MCRRERGRGRELHQRDRARCGRRTHTRGCEGDPCLAGEADGYVAVRARLPAVWMQGAFYLLSTRITVNSYSSRPFVL